MATIVFPFSSALGTLFFFLFLSKELDCCGTILFWKYLKEKKETTRKRERGKREGEVKGRKGRKEKEVKGREGKGKVKRGKRKR